MTSTITGIIAAVVLLGSSVLRAWSLLGTAAGG